MYECDWFAVWCTEIAILILCDPSHAGMGSTFFLSPFVFYSVYFFLPCHFASAKCVCTVVP